MNAVLCVREMFRDNITILQTKIREREINVLLNLLDNSAMNVTFLRLIQSTCSSPMGVDATQRVVALSLFNHKSAEDEKEVKRTDADTGIETQVNKKIIMEVYANNIQRNKVLWEENSIYYPEDPSVFKVLGYDLVTQGLPTITVSWEDAPSSSVSSKYNMLDLFGCQQEVSLRELVSTFQSSNNNGRSGAIGIGMAGMAGDSDKSLPPNGKLEKAGSGSGSFRSSLYNGTENRVRSPVDDVVDPGSDGPSPGQQGGGMKRRQAGIIKRGLSSNYTNGETMMSIAQSKKQVADYFIAQLYLTADLCLDRNYVAMHLIENYLEYETLVSILKLDIVPNQLKAPVFRILRTLYIDREPQVTVDFPRYIRTSVSMMEGGFEPFLASNGSNQDASFKFALLQQLLSDYLIRDIDPLHFDELSMESTSLLHALVNFGFYATTKQLQDILVPLIRILDIYTKPENRKASLMSKHAATPYTFKSSPVAYIQAMFLRNREKCYAIIASVYSVCESAYTGMKTGVKTLCSHLGDSKVVDYPDTDSDEDEAILLTGASEPLFTASIATSEATPLSHLSRKSYITFMNKRFNQQVYPYTPIYTPIHSYTPIYTHIHPYTTLYSLFNSATIPYITFMNHLHDSAEGRDERNQTCDVGEALS